MGCFLQLLLIIERNILPAKDEDQFEIEYPQVDASILITANVPSAKKIIVHGPTEPDDGAIPSQFPISEDIQVSWLVEKLDRPRCVITCVYCVLVE